MVAALLPLRCERARCRVLYPHDGRRCGGGARGTHGVHGGLCPYDRQSFHRAARARRREFSHGRMESVHAPLRPELPTFGARDTRAHSLYAVLFEKTLVGKRASATAGDTLIHTRDPIDRLAAPSLPERKSLSRRASR